MDPKAAQTMIGALSQLLNAQRTTAAATLAAALIGASGRPHSPAEAVRLTFEIQRGMSPDGRRAEPLSEQPHA